MRNLLLLTLFVLGLPLPALASGHSVNRQAMEKSAKKACIVGDFRKGTDILAELFVETNDATYIFNQGRCFEQSHQWQDAIDRFLEFLRKKPNLSDEERRDVQAHIDECQGHLTAQTSPVPVPPLAVEPPPPQPIPASPAADVPQSQTAQPVPEAEKSGSGLRIAGVVLGAVGVLGIGTGVYSNIRHESLVKDVNVGSASRGSLDTYKTAAWVGYGVGAAALVTGATLYILGVQAGNADSKAKQGGVALVPVFGVHGSTLFLSGAF